MDIRHASPLKWIFPLIFLALAGCAGAGPAGGTPTVGRGTALPDASDTALTENTPTPESASPTASNLGFIALAVAAGRGHTCALTDRRTVQCWGDNADGQLGDGTTAARSSPAEVLGLDDTVSAIATGYNHTCALTTGGEVYCWGNNAFGQIGDGTQTSRSTAGKVSLPGRMVAVSAGTLHSCATDGSDIFCWGVVKYEYLSGEDVAGISLRPNRIDAGDIPAGSRIDSIGSGFAHDCALTEAGDVYCWGRNDIGQLGRGGASYAENAPGKVQGIPDRARVLAVGGSHTCVIQTLGGIACWGYNKYGQLGNLYFHDKGGLTSFYLSDPATALSSGAYHTCAILQKGSLRCWGDDRFDQLGGVHAGSSPYVEVSGRYQSVAAGGSHTCGLALDGQIVCWGNNKFGQLGGSVLTPTMTPMPTRTKPAATQGPVETPTSDPNIQHIVTSIAAGRSHTCAVTAAGGVRCWGRNEHGELGDGTVTDSNVPVEVTGLRQGVKSVAVGWGHSCALTAAGGVQCWGYNKNGELGNNANVNSTHPVDVSGLQSGVVSIEAGDDHTCAVLAGGNLACWGYNEYGQLGDGTTDNRNVPVLVNLSTSGARAAALGWGHTCVLLSNGGVKCWGNNEFGQAGDGSDVQNRSSPVSVKGLTGGVAAISADGGHTCALTEDNRVLCWGNNKYGQLGDGTAEVRKTPVVAAGLMFRVRTIAAGWNSTCAVGGAGEMACWGWNYYGQLGNGVRTTSTLPVESDEIMYSVIAAAVGWGHTCVITELGGVQCFGWNEFGQLGDGTNENGYLPVDVIGLAGDSG
jgi:alpha-tubulin suppressor-like RCC1 family protein